MSTNQPLERRNGMREVLEQLQESREEIIRLKAEIHELKKEWHELEEEVKKTSEYINLRREDSEEGLKVYLMLRGAYKTGVYFARFLAWCIGILGGAIAAIAALKSGVWK